MSIATGKAGTSELFMGNEAIARGALEAGVGFAAAYPGTPSSEVIATLAEVAKEGEIYAEWSVNEKVAMEVAAAASFAGVRAIVAMKQNGVNVASDFLMNLNLTGTKAGLVIAACDDPSALSSTNEQDSRPFAKWADLPLLEPGTASRPRCFGATASNTSPHGRPGPCREESANVWSTLPSTSFVQL